MQKTNKQIDGAQSITRVNLHKNFESFFFSLPDSN